MTVITREEDTGGTGMERKMQLGQGWRRGRCSWNRDGELEEDIAGTEMAGRKMQLVQRWRGGRCRWDRGGGEENAARTGMAWRQMQLGQRWRRGKCSWDRDGSAHMMSTAESGHYDSDEDNHKRRGSIRTLDSNKQRGGKASGE